MFYWRENLMSYHSREEDHSYRTGNHERVSRLLGMARFGKLHIKKFRHKVTC